MYLRWSCSLALTWLICVTRVCAYEVETHADMSQGAFNPGFLPGGANQSLEGTRSILPSLDQTIRQPPVKWLRDGARDEDELTSLRFLNHFYNPLDDSGLRSWACEHVLCLPSPTWGIESQDVSGQDFSFADARRYVFTALTELTPLAREHAWAKTFYALGHVIHLIQDMAQPQHTRNDSHATGSLYEAYTDAKSAKVGFPYPEYDAVYRYADTTTFSEPLDFWHRVGGKGMADYSNRGFVSEGTNFCAADSAASCTGSDIPPNALEPYDILPHAGFPSPNGQAAQIISRRIEDLPPPPQYGPPPASGLHGDIDFITTPVYDAYTGETARNRLTSTYSIFDADLQKAEEPLTFTLNRYDFDDAHELLIPRAVAYSAGLMNYFFRGSFGVYATNYRESLYVVANYTAEPMDGTFSLYYDDAQGNREPLGSQSIWVDAYSTSPFQFSFAPDPRISDYTVVFQGRMGAETGAVTVSQTRMVSAPIVNVTGLWGGAASDPQNDLASYEWSVECSHDFGDGTFTYCPVQLSNSSGSLSGGQAGVPPPTFELPFESICESCGSGLYVTDSQGNAGWGGGHWHR